MCYILAYVIFIPIAKELSSKFDHPSISTAGYLYARRLEKTKVSRSNTLGGALMGVVSFLLVSGVYFSFY